MKNKVWTYEELVEKLHETPLYVTFTKVDGTERLMHCTLNSTFLPLIIKELEETQKQASTLETPNKKVVRVFDLDKQAWRSFKVDSVKLVEIPF